MFYGTAGFLPGEGTGSSLDGMPNNYHEADGSKVYLTTIPITPSQEDEIAARVGTLGGRAPGFCADSVSDALGGVRGISGSMWPGLLHDEAEKAARAK